MTYLASRVDPMMRELDRLTLPGPHRALVWVAERLRLIGKPMQ